MFKIKKFEYDHNNPYELPYQDNAWILIEPSQIPLVKLDFQITHSYPETWLRIFCYDDTGEIQFGLELLAFCLTITFYDNWFW